MSNKEQKCEGHWNNCCEKCKSTNYMPGLGVKVFVCGNTLCKCHAVPSQEEMDKAMLNLGKCDIISTNEKGLKVWECVWCGKKADNVEAFNTRCSILEDTKPEWERDLENLAAINYNLYLAGTCERKDTGENWTYSKALEEIKDFINSLLLTQREELERDISKKAFIGDNNFHKVVLLDDVLEVLKGKQK